MARHRILKLTPALIIAFFAFVKPAFAYLDPGSGTMILQAIVLAFVAGWFTIKNYWLKIIGLFRGGPKPDAEPEPSVKINNS